MWTPKAFSERDSDTFQIWKPDFTICGCKALSNQAFERRKNCVLDRDPPRKPDSEDLWMQSSLGTWFVRAHFGNARWICAVGTKFNLDRDSGCNACEYRFKSRTQLGSGSRSETALGRWFVPLWTGLEQAQFQLHLSYATAKLPLLVPSFMHSCILMNSN